MTMTLPKEYAGERCSLARALEVVGERWTLLIVRDAFFGVRRFGDFAAHLDIPAGGAHGAGWPPWSRRACSRWTPGGHGHDEYALTGKGRDLWPVIRLAAGLGRRALLRRPATRLQARGRQRRRRRRTASAKPAVNVVGSADLVVAPGPGLAAIPAKADPVSVALSTPHRLLQPLR